MEIGHGDFGDLEKQSHTEVHHSADRGKVVEGHQWIHLVLSTTKQSLNHDQFCRFEEDTSDLEKKSNHHESDLPERGNHDANDNDRDVEENLQVEFVELENPAQNQDRNGCCRLPSVSFSAFAGIGSNEP